MARLRVTGHTNLTEPTENIVYEALCEVLRIRSPAVGVTCLARGADQLFARAVLDLGGIVEVVLPASDYRTRIKPENLARYDALLAAADSVHVMPFDSSCRESYMAAGEFLLPRVDELIAVWDGGPSGGLGGTADVVAAARERGLPLQLIWPRGASRG